MMAYRTQVTRDLFGDVEIQYIHKIKHINLWMFLCFSIHFCPFIFLFVLYMCALWC